MKKILLIFMFSIVFTCTLANSSKVEHKSYEIEKITEKEKEEAIKNIDLASEKLENTTIDLIEKKEKIIEENKNKFNRVLNKLKDLIKITNILFLIMIAVLIILKYKEYRKEIKK